MDAVRRFVDATYAATATTRTWWPIISGGSPGCCDWPFVDKPWWGQVTDYSPVAQAAFRRGRKESTRPPPPPDPDWTHPDLRCQWRAWTQFKAYGQSDSSSTR